LTSPAGHLIIIGQMNAPAEMTNQGNMAPEDFEIAMKLCAADPEFKKLWDEHHELKERARELGDKVFLTPEEELEVKKIKRLKLWGKDKIAEKIRDYKVAVPPPA